MGASPVLARMAQILGFAMEMTRRRGPWRLQMRNPSFSPTLGNPHTTRVPTFPQRRLRLSPICIGEKLAKIGALVRFLHRTEDCYRAAGAANALSSKSGRCLVISTLCSHVHSCIRQLVPDSPELTHFRWRSQRNPNVIVHAGELRSDQNSMLAKVLNDLRGRTIRVHHH